MKNRYTEDVSFHKIDISKSSKTERIKMISTHQYQEFSKRLSHQGKIVDQKPRNASVNIQLNCFETLKITQNSKANCSCSVQFSNGLLKIT